MTTHLRKSIGRSPLRRGSLLISVLFAWFALSPQTQAVSPAPDRGYPNNNTAEGTGALKSVSTFGTDNTAIGFQTLFTNSDGQFNTATGSSALFSNTTGNFNTANGSGALFSNTTGYANTATGAYALFSNTDGYLNTAIGSDALYYNTTGFVNTATGISALQSNTTGVQNTANGAYALISNATGNNNTATGAFALEGNNADNNTATGFNALAGNTTGTQNTANGVNALVSNSTGSYNAAAGFQALANSTGSNNIALGANAGINLTTGNNNIIIGASGTAGESNTIRIGKGNVHKAAYMGGISGATVAGGVGVVVDARGHLGTVVSSQRFKEAIKPMDKASEAILALEPVTFRYKKKLDPDGIPQFGLVAEQVEKVNPDLVARDSEGKVNTVRYEAVNAMLLNEFLKEHRTVRDLKKEVAALTATVKEQAGQIQKVSAQLELSKPAPQVMANNQ